MLSMPTDPFADVHTDDIFRFTVSPPAVTNSPVSVDAEPIYSLADDPDIEVHV